MQRMHHHAFFVYGEGKNPARISLIDTGIVQRQSSLRTCLLIPATPDSFSFIPGYATIHPSSVGMVCAERTLMLRRLNVSVVSRKFLYIPFVVSLSNHERNKLNILALRQAQGERSLST